MTLSPIVAFLLGWIACSAVAIAASSIYDAVTTPRAVKTKDNRHA
jgi:hypothetical protein